MSTETAARELVAEYRKREPQRAGLRGSLTMSPDEIEALCMRHGAAYGPAKRRAAKLYREPYRVQVRGAWLYFPTLERAQQFSAGYFDSSGVVLGIEAA